MKRPLAAVVVCYAAGLLVADFFRPPLTALFAAAFLVFAATLFVQKIRPLLIWPLVALVGWTNLAVHIARRFTK
ncbi:MAG: hypothetical protein WDN00_05650 [Limisphaerales bacterium]